MCEAFMRDALKVLTEDEQKNLHDALVKLQEGMSRAGSNPLRHEPVL
jgi:hypothetical protein